MVNATLHEYLDIDSSVKFIRNKLETEFFLESNLFDLCVKDRIKLIIYYNGDIWITPIKEQSYCPDDFDEINNMNFLKYEFSQLTEFMGYVYLDHTGRDETSFDNMTSRHLINIQSVVASNPLWNINKINNIFNKNHSTYFATIPKNGDMAIISKDFDKQDLIKILDEKEKMGAIHENIEYFSEIMDRQRNLTHNFVEIKRKDIRFSINDLLSLIDRDLSMLIENIDKTRDFLESVALQIDEKSKQLQAKDDIIAEQAKLIAELQANQEMGVDKELRPNSQNAISKLLYALMIHGDFELDGTKQGNLNDRLVSLTNEKGVPVTEKFIAGWLEYLNDSYYFKKGK